MAGRPLNENSRGISHCAHDRRQGRPTTALQGARRADPTRALSTRPSRWIPRSGCVLRRDQDMRRVRMPAALPRSFPPRPAPWPGPCTHLRCRGRSLWRHGTRGRHSLACRLLRISQPGRGGPSRCRGRPRSPCGTRESPPRAFPPSRTSPPGRGGPPRCRGRPRSPSELGDRILQLPESGQHARRAGICLRAAAADAAADAGSLPVARQRLLVAASPGRYRAIYERSHSPERPMAICTPVSLAVGHLAVPPLVHCAMPSRTTSGCGHRDARRGPARLCRRPWAGLPVRHSDIAHTVGQSPCSCPSLGDSRVI